MSGNTTIEWTDFTFNPWWGCAKVSPGCDNCYAEAWARRFSVRWGSGETRRPATERTWSEPIKWDAQAKKAGVRRRVFCASMADVFDNEGLQAERAWLWELIEETPNLDWLLLTKRIGNVMSMVPPRWHQGFPTHVWMGATIVNQEEADRDIPKLLRVPAAVRFLSCEPLLGPIKLTRLHAHCPAHDFEGGFCTGLCPDLRIPNWIIVGGESGRKARPMNPTWARSLGTQCRMLGIPFFFKQFGEWMPAQTANSVGTDQHRFEDGQFVVRVGKQVAGRVLDGRTWDEFPRAAP